jgi:hypothetical protein
VAAATNWNNSINGISLIDNTGAASGESFFARSFFISRGGSKKTKAWNPHLSDELWFLI